MHINRLVPSGTCGLLCVSASGLSVKRAIAED